MQIIIIDLLIVAACLVGDLLTKAWAASALPLRGGYLVAIEDVLTFRYSENTGAAFGIFEDSRVFLSVFVGIVLLALLAYMTWTIVKKKYKEKGGVFFQVALSLILAGGIGNLVDRIFDKFLPYNGHLLHHVTFARIEQTVKPVKLSVYIHTWYKLK